ncbi:protein piccolo [Xyrauchen texanus]|uniref:protein piccolo n=1 Tax=Xyrauchen texanus TaxID=154827 RepID=UPI0022419240|nr:protein piccolo [Xyrauchen texanus]
MATESHVFTAVWLCLNCHTRRALAGQLGTSAPTAKPTVAPKTQPSETPVSTQTPTPKPSPGKQAEEQTFAKAVVTTSADAPTTDTAAIGTPLPTVGPVPAAVSTFKLDTAFKTEETTAVEEMGVAAPVPSAETRKAVINAAEVTLKETGKDTEGPGETQPDMGSMSMPPAVLNETDILKVNESTDTHLAAIEGLKEDVVIQMDTSITKISELAKVDTLKVADITDQQGQDILSASAESYSSAEEELKEIQRASEMSIEETDAKLLLIKAPDNVKQYLEDSIESDPSPQIQRRRVRPTSTSSEEYKLDSSNSGDDEEFIRRQLMDMGADETAVPSDEEIQISEQREEKEQQIMQEVIEVEKSDKKTKRVLMKLCVEPEESSVNSLSYDQGDQVAQVIPVSEALEETRVEIDVSNDNENIILTDFDTTAVVMTQKTPVRQVTDEYESIIEDSSKGDGSYSVQVSSITPGSASPTSVSSIDEDSDSSPRHRKASAERKHQRKTKQRQQGQQALPSSEEDEVSEDVKQEHQRDVDQQKRKVSKKSKTERDVVGTQRRSDHLTETDKLRQAVGIEEQKSSSSSDFSRSFESEPENDLREIRASSSETYERLDALEKPLKSAEEVYEEMMQKPYEKCTPPDIEPLYGGMLIEDYAYETLVEEQEQAATAICKTNQDRDVRILMTPDVAFEQMMQKRSAILQKEQEAQQTNVDSCYVTISGNEKPLLQAEDAYELLLKTQKDVITPGTSPTQSTPLSPVSPLSVSESSYDSPEVILIPSSGEEDNAAEPIECILDPYITKSTSAQGESVKKSLYPIPDLKITQCSSGEEEVDEEDSVPKEEMSYEPTNKEAGEFEEPKASEKCFETEPISVICEVSYSKHAAEQEENLPVQDSTISPLSPLTSPDSKMAQSSSPMSDQTPEPTTPSSPSVAEMSAPVVIQMPDLVSEQTTEHPSITTTPIATPRASPHVVANAADSTHSEVPVSKQMSGPKPTPAPKPSVMQNPPETIITETPERVSLYTLDSAPRGSAQTPLACETHESTPDDIVATTQKQTIAPVTALEQKKPQISSQTTVPVSGPPVPLKQTSVIVQMPDLVSLSLDHPFAAATSLSTSQESHIPKITLATVQMQDLVTYSAQSPRPVACPVPSLVYAAVSATGSAVDQEPISVSTIVSTPKLAKIPAADQTISAQIPVSAVEQIFPPLSAPSTIPTVAKVIQPPTSVYVQIPFQSVVETISNIAPPLDQAALIAHPVGQTEPIATKTVSVVSPTITTTVAVGASSFQPLQSVLADSQSRVEEIQQLQSVSQISPAVLNQQGQIVNVLPNFENVSLISQAAQGVIANSMAVKTTIGDIIVSISPHTWTATVPSVSSAAMATACVTDSRYSPCIKSEIIEPYVITVSKDRTDKPVIEFPPPPPASPPELPSSAVLKLDLNQQMTVFTPSFVKTIPPDPSMTAKPYMTPTHKSPPPVPPKPICVPPGLVFSHRSRESVKPPVSPEPVVVQAVRAATLPRTREPPNALSLSLSAPVESKHSASSPKSPLSPRFAKTLETYVVITLPSEPGSPVEGITTQAPMRKSSLPTPRQQVPTEGPRIHNRNFSYYPSNGFNTKYNSTSYNDRRASNIGFSTICSGIIRIAPVAAAPRIAMETTAFPATVYTAPSMVFPMALPSAMPTSEPSKEVTVVLAPVSTFSTEIVAQHTGSEVHHELEMQQMQTKYSAPLTITQIPIPIQNEDIQDFDMEEVLIVSAPEEALTGFGSSPVSITKQTVYEQKTDSQAVSNTTAVPSIPVTFTQFTKSVESQEIRGQDKVISSMSQVYSTISTSEHRPVTLPNLVTQVVTTEVQRTTTVSVVQERIPVEPILEPINAVTIHPEVQQKHKQNGRIHYPNDVVDLTTFKVNVTMSDQGMDLTAPDSSRLALSTKSSGRQATAVQPEIVNLSTEILPTPMLSFVTDSITIVTCTATIAYNNNNMVDKPLDLGNASLMPLPLTTYNPFEPLAQIVYRPVNSQPRPMTNADIPVNLSYRAVASAAPPLMPVTPDSVSFTNGIDAIPVHIEPSIVGPVDLTTSKPMRTMVSLSSSSGVVTTVVEDDGTPVDLTSGRRTVCCDVIYRFPFTGSCRTPPPVTTQPDNQLGFRDVHYQLDNATTPVIEDLSTVKGSISDINFNETGLFGFERRNGYTSQNEASEGAIDLTSSKMSTGQNDNEALDYSKKDTLAFTGITTNPYSQGTSFGINSLLRSSNGIVYSSVAAPVPSTYAITTQPGSIISTTHNSLTGSTEPALQNQPAPFGFVHTTTIDQSIFPQSDISKDILPSALVSLLPSLTAFPELYSDAALEAIAVSLDTLVSPNFPDLDDSKSQQYKAEHEFLQLEKLKQLCLAEELEWERQEIQRYRAQEQLIVQKELEDLQIMKQQLLMQQEEERKAHLIQQQETFAQQQLQLEQIHGLQQQLQKQLQEQKIYPYGFGPSDGISPPTSSEIILDSKYSGRDGGQYWPVKDDNSISPALTIHDATSGPNWLTSTTSGAFTPVSVSTMTKEQINLPDSAKEEQSVGFSSKTLVESGVQTDDEDGSERITSGRRRRSRRSVDSCMQTDDEDQEEWDVPVRSRRRSRSSRYTDGEKGKSSKVSSIAIQTVAEISVQTEHSGTIRRSPVRAQVDTKVNLHREGQTESDSDVTSDKDKRHPAPCGINVSTHLSADDVGASLVAKSPKVLCSPVSPVPLGKSTKKMLTAEPLRHLSSPRSLKASERSISDPKSLSPTTENRMMYQYSESYSSKGSQCSTPVGSQKKVKRTLPHPPPEEDPIIGYSTASARRRISRNTTMARAKILQDIDKELNLVERESSKLRKIQAELDEEEKEIDAKLRYLEMGINRRKEVLLKEREKRERAYLQGVAEERDYMSDSEVSNIREARGNGHGLERPRTAPQSDFNQFIPPQTETESQYAQLTSPYSHYQYASQSQTPQQTLYQQSLYHQQVYPYQSIYSSVPLLNQQSQHTGYDHSSLLLMPQKPHQTTLSDLEQKITTNYEVVRNQPLLIVPTSTESAYGVSHLGGKYGSLDLRMGLEERASMASSPMSSISTESFFADLDNHNTRNYVLIDDIGELTKGSTDLGSSFSIANKDISKADRLLRTAEVRRTADVADFLSPFQAASRLHSYSKVEEDSMEEPYELKMLKQQIKQEFRQGTDSLEQLTGLPHYLHSDTGLRHFPKADKYSIGRLTLEKQAAKQLHASVLYQKQLKNKKALIDPKKKFSPIQESRDLELDYSSFLATSGSSVGALSARARLLQDEITFGLRKNIAEQQKYLGSALGANLAQSLNFGQSLNLGPNIRSSLHDDGTYPIGTRSRPSSRPSSVYGLDLSIKRDLSNSSLRLKTEGEGMDSQIVSARAKPTSLPISQSRGRIPIVAQNSEEESPLSPVGQPMGMARASAGPLPPISADSRDQFGSSHSLPEVQQHMREESRTSVYERDIGFIKDELQGAMSDSEAGGPSWNVKAYHLQNEETDWFDKPHQGRGGPEVGQGPDRRQMKGNHYPFPHARIKLQRDPKDNTVSGSGLGIRVVGGKEIPGTNGEIGAYIAKVSAGRYAEQTGKVVEGMQVLEWNRISLVGKTYEEVQSIVGQQCGEAEICVRLDFNMLSDTEHPQQLELQTQLRAGERQRSPGVDPKQLAAELQKVSQQQAPASVLSALERAGHLHSVTGSAASNGVPSPGQPESSSVNKKRHSSKSAEALKTQPHSITGEIQLQINYDKNMGNLIVHVLQARNLVPRENNGYSDPFVKVYLLPGRGAENKRRTKYIQKTQNPEWNQTVIYKNIHLEQLKKKTLEVTVWDYDRYSSNDFLGEVLIDLSNTAQLDNTPRWHPLKEQSESIHHGRGHGGQPGNQQSPKTSVIKSQSHGIFPDPAKDTQVTTIEKSHSSPGSSKSSSEGHLRSHGPSRSQSKGSVTQAHLEEAGNAIAAAEAAVQQARLQPNKTSHRMVDGDGYTLDSEDGMGTNALDSAIFQVPQLKNIPNGTDKCRGLESLNLSDSDGKMMGEIKVALKKEMKTEGEQLVLEILQCRNITYKFKSPDHLPDLYVKLYVVNVATQKRIIKKKTRVCRHDREPSFNETFRFNLNPVGHSIQLFLVSNGGKFMKKTLIGEAYIWLDKVDMRKRAVSWHKLVPTTNQTQP